MFCPLARARNRIEPLAVLAFELGACEHLTPCTDEAVTGYKLSAKPRDGVVFIDGVEPEGNLGEFDCNRIAVHPVNSIVSKVSLHLLLFEYVVVVPYHPACLALFALEIGISQLIHGFVQKGATAEGGLADVQAKDVVGGPVFE